MNDREALAAALAGQNLYHGRHGTTPAGMATAMAILAALAEQGYAVTRSETGLDVERLARALKTVLYAGYETFGDCVDDATDIAAEYVRLAAEPEPSDA